MSQVNATAFAGPYVDQSRTKRNPPAQTIVKTPTPAGPTTLGEVTVYDVAGVDHTPDNSAAPDNPHAPNSWQPGRDIYANNGMVGQDQFKHN